MPVPQPSSTGELTYAYLMPAVGLNRKQFLLERCCQLQRDRRTRVPPHRYR